MPEERTAMQLLTRPEAAEYLRVSLRKLDALAASGEIPRSKYGKCKRALVVFDKKDLEQFVLQHKTNQEAHTEAS